MKAQAQKHINRLEARLRAERERSRELFVLLQTACRYCNNLENHMKTIGKTRKEIESIKSNKQLFNPAKGSIGAVESESNVESGLQTM